MRIPLLIISLLLLSGCISINITQTLHRDGTYDMEMAFKTSAEFAALLTQIKSNLTIDPSVKERASVSLDGETLTYTFKDLDPSKDKRLFISESQEGAPSPSEAGGFKLEKTTKFPYDIYTYRTVSDTPAASAPQELSEAHLMDEAGLLSAEQRSQALAQMRSVFADDEVEIIILTSGQPGLESRRGSLPQSFAFQGPKKQYVLISASADGSSCALDSNLYFESEFQQMLTELDEDNQEMCEMPALYVTQSLEGIASYLGATELNATDALSAQMASLFSVTQTVRVFGEITQTSGEKVDGKTARFTYTAGKQEEQTIEFRELVFIGLLGDNYMLYLGAAGVFVLGVVVIFAISAMRKRKEQLPPTVPVAANAKLLEYVEKARRYGSNDAQIQQTLVSAGWKPSDVQTALNFKRL